MELLHQRIELKMNFDARHIKGKSSLWIRQSIRKLLLKDTKNLENPNSPWQSIFLNCRQCFVSAVTVNGFEASFEHMDPLLAVVLKQNVKDAETFDINYRAKLMKAAGESTGELRIFLPREIFKGRNKGMVPSMSIPEPPSPLPKSSASLAIARRDSVARVMLSAAELATQSTSNNLFGPGQSAYRYMHIEIFYELRDSKTGLIWCDGSNLSGPSPPPAHCYTTYSHSSIDVDGPRCWFPCLDSPRQSCIFELLLALPPSQALVALFNGRQVGEETNSEGWQRLHFCSDTCTPARGVGLAVGPFRRWEDPHAPRLHGYYLQHPIECSRLELSNMDRTRKRRSQLDRESTVATALGMLREVVAHTAEWLHLDFPFSEAKHVFVGGLLDRFTPFGGLVLLREEMLCPNTVPPEDNPGDVRLASAEGMLQGWVHTAIRLRNISERWIHHGLAGFLLEMFLETKQGKDVSQARLWRMMETVISYENELGGASIHPPDADLYLPEAIERGVTRLTRSKSTLLMLMLRANIGRETVQSAFRTFMETLPINRNMFELNKKGTKHKGNKEGEGGKKSKSEEYGTPPRMMDSRRFFNELVKSASEAGREWGVAEADNFYSQYILGGGVLYLRGGYSYSKRTRAAEVVLAPVHPPWSAVEFKGEIEIVVWEVEGRWQYMEQFDGSRGSWSFPTHSKPRRRRKTYTRGPQRKDDDQISASQTIDEQAKVPIAEQEAGGNEELEAFLEAQDLNSSAILWVNIDPNRRWLRRLLMRKPEYQWVEQLYQDDGVESQLDAVSALVEYPLYPAASSSIGSASIPPLTVRAIGECLRGQTAHTQIEHAVQVRSAAAEALAAWQTDHAPGLHDPPNLWQALAILLQFFNEHFVSSSSSQSMIPTFGASHTGPESALLGWGIGTLLPNWFDDQVEYTLKKVVIWAISCIRGKCGACPAAPRYLLLILLRDNDNTENVFSDDYHVAQVLVAAGQTVAALGTNVGMKAENELVEGLWIEVTRWVEIDELRESHNCVITACALQALSQIELFLGGTPRTPFHKYISTAYYPAVRVAAIQSIIHHYLAEDLNTDSLNTVDERSWGGFSGAVSFTLGIIEEENDQWVLQQSLEVLLDALERFPPRAAHLARFQSDDPLLGLGDPWCSYIFAGPRGGLNSIPRGFVYQPNSPIPKSFPDQEAIAHRLWDLMVAESAYSQSLRSSLLRLWRVIWGWGTPHFMPPKPDDWLEKSERSLVKNVRNWIMYRPTRREACRRDVYREFYALENEELLTEYPHIEFYGPETISDDEDDNAPSVEDVRISSVKVTYRAGNVV